MKSLQLAGCFLIAATLSTENFAQTSMGKTYQFIDRYPSRTIFFHLDLVNEQQFRINLLDTRKGAEQTGDTLVIRGLYRKQGDTIFLQDGADKQNSFTIVQDTHKVSVQGTYFLPAENKRMTLNHTNPWH